MARVVIYASGPVVCSVCVPAEMPREEIERSVNAQSPTGISSSWKISKDSTFKGGEPNPCQCNDGPQRLHYLMDC